MRLPISDQYQTRPYLAPFSHNTSVTDDRQWWRTDNNRAINTSAIVYSIAAVHQKEKNNNN